MRSLSVFSALLCKCVCVAVVLVDQLGVLIFVDVNLIRATLPVRRKHNDGLGLDFLRNLAADLLEHGEGRVPRVVLHAGLLRGGQYQLSHRLPTSFHSRWRGIGGGLRRRG